MMMAGSIEGRMPFMDTVLASVVARFPDEFLTRGKGGKTVLRAAMGAAGRRRVEQEYSLQRQIQKIEAIYRDVFQRAA